MSEEDSCYSNDEEYFLDLCRSGDFQQLKEFISSLDQSSQFNWEWFSDTQDNFVHMLAANNFVQIFEYLLPVLKDKCSAEKFFNIINKQNYSANTPLHYAVITDSKEMVAKLLEIGANPQIKNQHERTPFQEAEKFDKFQIAELLAPVTKMDLKEIQKIASELKLNDDEDDDSSDEEENMEEKIEEKVEEKKKERMEENVEQNVEQKKEEKKEEDEEEKQKNSD